MPCPLLKITTTLLLIAQVLIASARGQTLCVPLRPCTNPHEFSHATCHSHAPLGAEAADEPAGEPGRLHAHDACLSSDSPCACHLHVPFPADPQAPLAPRCSIPELHSLAETVDAAPPGGLDLRIVNLTTPRPPDFTPRQRALVIESTRLRI
jgi:hypothetical protein